ADPGGGRPALLPPPLRRAAHARDVRRPPARRGRPRDADRRPARRRRRDRPARPRLGVAAMKQLAWAVFGVWAVVSVAALPLAADSFSVGVTVALGGGDSVSALV